jgi:hypothetical protein
VLPTEAASGRWTFVLSTSDVERTSLQIAGVQHHRTRRLIHGTLMDEATNLLASSLRHQSASLSSPSVPHDLERSIT